MDSKNQTLTPNPGTICFKLSFNTKDVGAVVIEIPAADGAGSITGTIMDSWQAALEDVGPAGAPFEVLIRFCGPEKPLFEKTWTLPDIERLN